MRFLHLMPLVGALVLPPAPDLFQEPGYIIAREGDRWVVRKPGVGAQPPITISQHRDPNAAELHRNALPRLRLAGPFVRFDPITLARSVIDDWTAQEDARRLEADIRRIVTRFAPAGPRELLQLTAVYMTRLAGATGHTAEERGNPARFVVYVDPFRATGRLHAAATLVHELTHVERYGMRGFHANRAAAVLTKRDFVLLGLADEFGAYEAEASMLRSFLGNQANPAARSTARDAMCKPELGWPLALVIMLGFEGYSDQARRNMEARHQVLLDLEHIAGRYWDTRHMDSLDPQLRKTIRDWYRRSREWKKIEAERSEWRKAERALGHSNP